MGSEITLQLVEHSGNAAHERSVSVDTLVIAGWTGRDADAIEKHIKELEEIGVPRPSATPLFYRVSNTLLTTADTIEVPGTASSGEVEFVLIGTPDGMLMGIGSDHTEREVEAFNVVVSKQMCAKPVSSDVWRFDDVADHWDELLLKSWATVDGEKRVYQEGSVTAMKDPRELIAMNFDGAEALPAGTAMYCGTLAVHGGVAAADRFDVEIEDPVLSRKLSYGYDIRFLPMVS